MSLFQSFPPTIAESILKYSLNIFHGGFQFDKRATLSFMRICRNWRIAFIGTIFDSLALEPGCGGALHFRFSKCDDCINPLDFPLAQLVKSLEITLSSWDNVISGEVGSLMSSAGFDEVHLTRLKSFSLNVIYPRLGDTFHLLYASETMSKMLSFVHLLHQMTISISSVRFDGFALDWPVNDDDKQFLIPSVLDIFRRVNSIALVAHDMGSYLRHSGVFATGNLTSISFRNNSEVYDRHHLELVKLNAANVVNIDINGLPVAFIRYLIMDNDGWPLEYPCLRLLKLSNTVNKTTQWPNTFGEECPGRAYVNYFPVLKALELSGEIYPFHASILAEGVNKTLESLTFFYYRFPKCGHLFLSLRSTQFTRLNNIAFAHDSFDFFASEQPEYPPLDKKGRKIMKSWHQSTTSLKKILLCR